MADVEFTNILASGLGTGQSDFFTGTAGTDASVGQAAPDYVAGQAGNDSLVGGEGDDTVTGGLGNDTVGEQNISPNALFPALPPGLPPQPFPEPGNDWLSGDAGNDTVNGGAGDDTIVGGPGADSLRGGADNDKFLFNQGDLPLAAPFDVIADFSGAGTQGMGEQDQILIDTNTGTGSVLAVGSDFFVFDQPGGAGAFVGGFTLTGVTNPFGFLPELVAGQPLPAVTAGQLSFVTGDILFV